MFICQISNHFGVVIKKELLVLWNVELISGLLQSAQTMFDDPIVRNMILANNNHSVKTRSDEIKIGLFRLMLSRFDTTKIQRCRPDGYQGSRNRG